ncbi:MAG: hypothetical protein AABM64_18620 [Pseudomonadota bacterium]
MSKLLNVALAAALGFAVSTALYAADTSQSSQANRSTAWSDAEVRAAMDKCNNLTGTPRAKCIVNIRPTPAGDKVAMNRSTASSDAEVRAGMDKCNNLTGTPRAKCIVNIRPTPAGDKVAMTPGSSAEGNTVKDGTAITEAEYAAAVKECESANAADKDRCVNTAKEHFGRM